MKLKIDIDSADAAANDLDGGLIRVLATVTLRSDALVGVPISSELHLNLKEAKRLHLALGRVLKNLD